MVLSAQKFQAQVDIAVLKAMMIHDESLQHQISCCLLNKSAFCSWLNEVSRMNHSNGTTSALLCGNVPDQSSPFKTRIHQKKHLHAKMWNHNLTKTHIL
jgi:hypothetical protein